MAGCGCNLGRKRSLGQNNGKGIGLKGGLMIGLAFAALFVANKIFGKDDNGKPPPPKDLPDAGSGIPQGWSPRPLAQELYDTMSGIAWNPMIAIKRDAALLQLIGLQSDDMFVAVYNDFTQNFGGGDTLRQWIEDESLIPPTISAQLNARFNTLALSGKGMSGWLYTPGIDPNRQYFNWNLVNWRQQFAKASNSLNDDLMISTKQPW